jgi:hypothetical protein
LGISDRLFSEAVCADVDVPARIVGCWVPFI